MARRRFFVPEVRRGMAELTGHDAEHLVRVLRAEEGQRYEISDNRDVYLAEITSARKSSVCFEVIEKLAPQPELPPAALVIALVKFDRLEWLIEKATELGVTEIRFFEAVRTERGLLQAARKRLARWEKIALEASQQARRAHLPHMSETNWKSALATDGVKMLLDENPGAPPLRKTEGRAALLVGPEGGWTDGEREEALAAGWQPCSLGPTILRTETAALAGLAIATRAR
ncbi:MAG TPA: RsmE family RNA methyltransferase [Bryobacteraceae bacterium]|jgi:16S rRNA (uracil1498-N3)-methyltransferase